MDNFDESIFFSQTKKICENLESERIKKIIISRDKRPIFYIGDYKSYQNLVTEYTKLKTVFKEYQDEVRQNSEIEITEAQKMLLRARKHFEFFDNLDDSDILDITKDVNFMKFDKGEVVFEQESEGKEIYFILKGGINIEIGQRRVIGKFIKWDNHIRLAVLKQQDIFGEMATILNESRSARAMANTKETILLSFKLVDELSEYNIVPLALLYQNFLKILARRVKSTNDLISESKKRR